MSLRDAILNASDIQSERVDVAEWGVTVEVRGMNGTQRAGFMERAFDMETGKPRFDRMYPEILIATVHDPETGKPVFEPTDRDLLNSKSAAATERVASVAMRLSGLDASGVDAKAVEAGKAA